MRIRSGLSVRVSRARHHRFNTVQVEPYRVFRRLLILEGWSHDQAYTPVFS
jgi:hypothetical protein